MGLSKKEVDAVAHLARLDISDEMAEKMAGQLSQVLDLIAKLNELDTTGVEPLSHPGALASVLRDDVPAGSLPRESRAPERAGRGRRLLPRAARDRVMVDSTRFVDHQTPSTERIQENSKPVSSWCLGALVVNS